jgi:hypothetical protein
MGSKKQAATVFCRKISINIGTDCRPTYHASQRADNGRATGQQHGCHQDVRHDAKDGKDPAHVSSNPPFRNLKTYKCVVVPNLALITSRKVWALGALLFNSIAILANNRICTVAPEAYQKGPETPYLYATAELCRRVAAHVQEETTADATRPDLTVLPAVLNISDVWSSLLYLLRIHVTST